MRPLPVLSLLTFVLLAQPGAADATMVKCRGDHGSVVYQDTPCKPGMEMRDFDTDPATVSVVPGTPVASQPLAASAQRTRTAQTARRQAEPKISSGRAAERRFIRVGMSEVEVIRRIGKPEVDAAAGRKQRKDGKHWSYLPAAGDADTITTISIAGGVVTDVERKIVR
jgi:Domain of unknown function (DUF4124)